MENNNVLDDLKHEFIDVTKMETVEKDGNVFVVGVDVANGSDQTFIPDTNLNVELVDGQHWNPSLTAIQDDPAAFNSPDYAPIDLDRAKQLFGMEEQSKMLTNMRSEITDRFAKELGGEEIYDVINAKLVEYTVDQIKAASDELITEIFTVNGELVTFEADFGSQKNEFEFRRDFLVYTKESSNAIAELDAEQIKLNTAMEESREEINQLISQFGDLDNYVNHYLNAQIEATEDGELKDSLLLKSAAFNDALTLDRLYTHYQEYSTSNTLEDAKKGGRSQRVYDKYMKVINRLGVKTDLTNFVDLERKYLPEKYHKYPNLFLFAVIKYVGYMNEKATRTVEGLFLSQLSLNISNLFKDGFTTPERKETFVNAIQNVLDLFYPQEKPKYDPDRNPPGIDNGNHWG